MKKPLLLCLAVAGIFLCTYQFVRTLRMTENAKEVFKEGKNEGSEENEDGILQAMEQDFRNTRDINLGYIPKYRLIEASEQLAKSRRMMGNSPAQRTTALSWIERGPNTDVTGPSNGNPRGPVSTTATSGRIRAIWVDLSDVTNHTVWVGGVDGGIWKTNDISASPATWTPVNDFLGNLAVASITQDPTDFNTMYFGTGEKSFNTDAVRGGGIWKSTDHGVTWNLLANTTGFWNVSKIACDNAGNVYVATIGNNAGLQRSLDKGATWANISPSGLSLRISELKLSSTGRLHVVCGYYNTAAASAGYRYTDNPSTVSSATWVSPVTSFPAPQFNSEIAVAGTTLYAVNSDATYQTPVIYKSTDGGANWAATATSPPNTGSNDDFSSGQGWYCIAAAVNPSNPNQVVVGGLNTYRTSNGGGAWTEVARWVGVTMPYVHADQHYATWNGSQVLIASDGGIFYSSDGGVTYADRNTGLRIKQFYSVAIHPTSVNYMIGGAQDNGVHQLNNPGLGGSVEVIGGDGAFSHIDQDQPQYQFSAYVYNQYRRSTNSGANWGSVNHSATSGQFINPTDYDDYNNKLYAAGNAGTYVRWENPQSGNTFTIIPVPAFNNTLVSHVMVSPHALNRVYFGTDGGKILKADTADQATPLVTNITGSGMSIASVSCVAVGATDNRLMATFSNYGAQHIWVTSTGGGAAGWTNISGNLPDIPVRWAMFYPGDDTKAIIATEMGIFETNNINGAATVWTQNSTFPIVRTDMLQYRPSDGLLAAATHGRGIWSSSIPVLSTNVQFASSEATLTEQTSVVTGCNGYRDYTVYMSINRAPVGNATATVSVSGGTGTQGADFDFTTNGNFATPSNTLTFANGLVTPQPVTIRIYDDANTEADETFTLSYTLSGATDAVPGTESQTFTCTLKDNDPAPNVLGAPTDYTVGTYSVNLATATAFRSNQVKHRLQVLFQASELLATGASAGTISSMTMRVVTKNSTKPFTNYTISLATTAATDVSGGFTASPLTQVYTGNYSSSVGDNVFAFGTGAGSSASFVWDGVSNIVVQYCFDNTAAGADATADVMEGSNPFATPTSVFSNGGAGAGCSLAATSTSVSRVNATFRIAGAGNAVETALNATKTLAQTVGNDVYYFSNGKIMARVRDLSGFNYGCTQLTIDRAGSGATAFTSATNTTFLTDKTFHVVPTTNNASGQYEITLYYTAAEKAGWEAATGNLWSSIRVVKVKSQISNYTPATPAPDGPNAIDVLVPVHGTFGSDYTLTATVTNGFSGFAAGIPALAPLPVNLVLFQGHLEKNTKAILEWRTDGEQNARDFEIEKSSDGVNYYKIGSVPASGTTAIRKDYTFSDIQLSPANYYRLRINDADGRNKLSQVVMIRVSGAKQNLWVVKNPFSDHLEIRLAQEANKVKLQLISLGGTVLAEKQFANINGQFTWQIPAHISKGTYILNADVDGINFHQKIIRL